MSVHGRLGYRGHDMVDGLDALQAITFFIEDLASTRRFYEQVFGLKVLFEDQHSAAFRLGGVIINLLQAERAPELVTPLPVGGGGRWPALPFHDRGGKRRRRLRGAGPPRSHLAQRTD